MSWRPCKRSPAGFTLLEMLVALAIFALLSVMSYSGLRSVMQQQSVTELEAGRLAQLQKIYLVMQRDFEQVVPRAVRDEYGDELAPLVGGESLQLTRGGWSNPLGHPRSTLQRVGYAYTDKRLVRYTWTVLDRAQDSAPLEQPLTEDITLMDVRYLDGSGEWKTSWPDTTAAVTAALPPATLPVAVEITLEHKHYGELVWLFRMPV
ncbi:MAG: type II secretion system minor pseudopilin GspJ [Gammaproteobacteria bacterium]|nr:type II secretion system minor pseudopilin GspJ [Gammaproteobacteria bacterium]